MAANLAALELHVPQWRLGPRGAHRPPDLGVFDLAPGEVNTVVARARHAEGIAERVAAPLVTAHIRRSLQQLKRLVEHEQLRERAAARRAARVA